MSTAAAPRPDLTTFIAGLPKAELHVHHVGSASPRIVAELAGRHPDSPVPQDPEALVRAARLYTLAVRIVDDIEHREALPFMHSDLARVRDELRTLASERIANRTPGIRDTNDPAGTITRMFREIAVRIEQRLERRNDPADRT